MALSLKQQIRLAEQEVRELERAVKAQQSIVNKLLESRVFCIHEWEPAVPNYEHEGKHCSKCGINNIYAYTLAQLAKETASHK